MTLPHITADSSPPPGSSSELREFVCISQLIGQRAQQQPHIKAVVDDSQSITYGELDRRSHQLAAHLQQLGAREEILVGLALPPTVELLVGVLAILKAGAAYLPLDLSQPRERLAYILNDASPALVLTTQAMANSLPPSDSKILPLDAETSQIFKNQSPQLQPASSPSSLAYVIYTSGTTGRPKGVLLEHQGLSDMAQFHAEQFQLDSKSHFLQFASLCFDASILEIFCTLTAGATLHLTDAANKTPGQPLIETLQQRKISHILLPPSTLQVLPDAPLPDLKVLIAGGEPCTADVVKRWAVGLQLINAYGPTEATVTATTWVCQPNDPHDPPIGHACANTDLYILDPQGKQVPPGQPGELYIGGSGVARGYNNQPELTRASFLPDPFSKQHQAKLYKTGDRVRQREDGALEFLGRLDRQVKVRGFRIELEEIESTLTQHPQIEQAYVQLSAQHSSHDSLVAYYVAANPLDAQELRPWLEDRLPNYMLPAHFVALEKLPRQQNGDIDPDKLPPPTLGKSDQQPPPSNSLESKLTQIWTEVLGFDQIGLHDHFIELGGDSLLSVRIAEKSQQQGIDLSPQDILSYPTINDLVELLAND